MIVIINPEAEEDFDRIGDTIAEHNPPRAITFIAELRRRCEALAHTPRRFPLIPRYEKKGVRRVVHGNYLIFYRIDAQKIDVLRILHGAMNYEKILFPTG
jgi:toxin ParE1/3/4